MKKQKLIETRNAKGLSQQDIADKLFIHKTCYCKRESGETKITLEEWFKLSEILQVQINEIYEDESENQTFITNHNNGAIGNFFSSPTFKNIDLNLVDTLISFIKQLREEVTELKKENAHLRVKK